MQTGLLARETGDLSPHDLARSITDQLLHAFAPAPQHRFHGEAPSSSLPVDESVWHDPPPRAHAAGVSALAVEKFDGRLLVSGGAEGSIKIWDLDEPATPHTRHIFRPVGTIRRDAEGVRVSGGGRSGGHSHGITHLAFYAFDQDAFLSSSYDKTLKLWATQRAALTASFDLNATVYSHAMSPLAGHLLVSCATQHSNVRLVDLKSGAAVQALVSHGGPVLTTAWSPLREHVLASGHADGKVRIWDVRRAGGAIALLDQEDSLGITGGTTGNATAQAHDEPVNGLAWTDDGAHIVSAGLDRKVRVWDAATGANTLASFGARIQNQHARTAALIVPASPGGGMLVWPNDHEILMLDLLHGTLLTRLRSPHGPGHGTRTRITSIAWRSHGGGTGPNGRAGMGGNNSLGAIYSAHSDGQMRAWMPLVPGPDDVDEADPAEEAAEEKSRKRRAIDSAYRSFMGREITFTGRGGQ
ncbi:hypothetical protein E4U42_005204 [Claviceps africana]|uniref:DNA excision repair protein ERCC-8 n=1 Tax=Claviceps africana TaxID=83212 RepID=A0A8K0J4L8_9HYPO|nr:hypothetical protein E4U42_005204 [Claviceps africana]